MTLPVANQSDLVQTIAANAADIHIRMAAAAARAGRDPDAVRLIAVTKTFPVEVCRAALDAGLTNLGENRVQEGVAKAAALDEQGRQPIWHLIGHLQTNKVKAALTAFAMIHSVDSIDLAAAINRRASASVAILLEINVAAESSKFGLSPDALPAALEQIAAMPHLDVRGLMTVAPQTHDAERVRPVFRRLHDLAVSLGLPELSMGMSGDFEVAIEEGATMVRIGSALFGPRPAPGGSA
ncbi:MAG: YggS family pyridoxal phosphate-dependent enzyme [Dehalococcoidia bacterium]